MQHHSAIIILRQRQLLLRVLKLWIVIDDHEICDLVEEKPILIEKEQLPIKLVAKNGYHRSRPFYIRKPFKSPLYIEIGCTADNGRLWGGVAISTILFAMFFASGLYVFLVMANLPLVYLVYQFFFNFKAFITIDILSVD